ncbi:MAG TPA: DNA gyrase modulator, partial [Opitutaceae bacterium]|nr:DNA gyrase modulator [Opitutaceae bacterium]
MDLIDIGQTVLGQVQRTAGPAQAEVFLLDSESRVSDWSENKPENRVVAQSRGLGLRLIRDNRLGFSFTNHWDKDTVENVIRQAVAASESTTPDPLLELPEPVEKLASNGLDLIDKTLTDTSWEPRTKFLESLDGIVRKREPRISKVLRGSYREGRAQVAVVNSKGVAAAYEGTSAAFSLACVA